MPLAEQRELDYASLEAWRLRQLLNAGWTLHRAEQIAARLDIDLHRATDLLAQGCDQRTALRILL